MTIVLDSSTTIAFLIDDERTAGVTAVMRQVGSDGGVVPSLWRLEVANVLQSAVRRKRITATLRDGYIDHLRTLPIEIDDQTDDRAWSSTLRLAEQHGLTAYDAAYLELASRRRLPLASLDQRLRDAAGAAGVAIL